MAAAGFPSHPPILSNFRPAAIRAAAGGGPDGLGRRSLLRRDGSVSGSWWTPLLGWPSEPDYVSDEGPTVGEEKVEVPASKMRRRRRRRFAALTEEKARELRRTTMATQGFHDAMYHSAIASRLASHLPPAL